MFDIDEKLLVRIINKFKIAKAGIFLNQKDKKIIRSRFQKILFAHILTVEDNKETKITN